MTHTTTTNTPHASDMARALTMHTCPACLEGGSTFGRIPAISTHPLPSAGRVGLGSELSGPKVGMAGGGDVEGGGSEGEGRGDTRKEKDVKREEGKDGEEGDWR